MGWWQVSRSSSFMKVAVVVGGSSGWECMSSDHSVVKCTRVIVVCYCSWFVFYSLWFGSMFVREKELEEQFEKRKLKRKL